MAAAADLLPADACPDDRVVAVVTMHPSFVAKSYYPTGLLESAGFEAVGSRPTSVIPEAIARRRRDASGEQVVEIVAGEESRATTELYVSVDRDDLRSWARHLQSSEPLRTGEDDLAEIEALRLPSATERLRLPDDLPDEIALEVVLHASEGQRSIIRGFAAYSERFDVDADLERRFYAGGLCFLPVFAPRDSLGDLAQFAFLRVARLMPRLRTGLPEGTVLRRGVGGGATLPTDGPIDPDLRVAVFDGGVVEGSCLEPWVRSVELDGLGDAEDEFLDHGHHVTSALLFGSSDPSEPLPRPFAYVDHFRVLDAATANDPYELYDVLNRIDGVLSQTDYEFISLSLGPDLPIEDDEVHSWTAFWDDRLADGRTLATFAVGNNGELDRPSGNARIQVPADCVNGLAVGAASSAGSSWTRAPYSAVGPGRRPGVVKPDLLGFGGVTREPFLAVSHDKSIDATAGTSFAGPATLRTALGVRAAFGERLGPLALKALMIHTAEPHDTLERDECGWGRSASEVGDIVLCGEGEARVLYQGELTPAKYLRAQLPLPANLHPGFVTIKSTLVYATSVDAQDPSNYTRSGIDVTFRPHADRFEREDSVNPRTKPFFSRRPFATETELRQDAHKWETVLHDEHRFRASSLERSVFDIHYNARYSGHPTASAPKIHYAMVITVLAPRNPDVYDEVLRTYATRLEALTPVLDLPIRLST